MSALENRVEKLEKTAKSGVGIVVIHSNDPQYGEKYEAAHKAGASPIVTLKHFGEGRDYAAEYDKEHP